MVLVNYPTKHIALKSYPVNCKHFIDVNIVLRDVINHIWIRERGGRRAHQTQKNSYQVIREQSNAYFDNCCFMLVIGLFTTTVVQMQRPRV